MSRPEDDDAIPLNYDETMDRKTFEAYAADRMDEALWTKLEQVLWDDTFDLQPEEYDRLEQFTGYGRYSTAAIGITTFGFLRLGRFVVARHGGAITTLFRRQTTTATPPTGVASSPFQQPGSPPLATVATTSPPNTKPSLGWMVFRICIDLTLSYIASFVAPIVLVDELTVAEACVDMPLLPGSSTVADIFCPVTQRELRQLQAEATTEEHQQALREPLPSSLYLQALVQFARNCELRQQNRGGMDVGDDDDDDSDSSEWVEQLTSDNERFDK